MAGTKRKLFNSSSAHSKPSSRLAPPTSPVSSHSPFQSLPTYGAVSPPAEGVDDVIVGVGVSRVLVAIPAN